MTELFRALKRSLSVAHSELSIQANTLVCEGMHVKVGPTRPDGKPHPHAGKTGRITRFIDIHTDPPWLGPPSAMIRLDSGIKPRGVIWVSRASLEVLHVCVMPRVTIVVNVTHPEEVAASEDWFARWGPALTYRSGNLGCRRCVNVWEVEGPDEALAALPSKIKGQ